MLGCPIPQDYTGPTHKPPRKAVVSLVDGNSDIGEIQRYACSANPEVVLRGRLSVRLLGVLATGWGC